ncbi:SDR family NAD(P)-dependent oxidoreductase [Testudinibacter sp. TR-2022]|nr:SDR family NAD(P)-dependent oxidoreductase [Pasteurellaceae bacterium Phil31]TNH09896.1 SDR family NAD(P)-dependent oxidoreductase [Testudinibacter sp. TR-2022]TNH10579.1 SDR family NAD(P)-dependent oxidoreductase [Testudinibacter sp. TR-2022]TNH13658.1 SDR family NAD(P)-dependent oxidoreductase [Testudinibacter sp. TR-2022]TNH18169.1 SDR family NAD(P)-dependent oxidoreductase [Testudinibacter sp. TR-2022]
MMTQKYFITGASGGLGIELVKKALNEGHTVVAAVRKPAALADLGAEYRERLIVEQLDVTQIDSLAAVAAKHTDIDVLVNNAGGAILGAMEELSDAQVQQQLDLNLVAPIHLTRAFLPALRAKKSGVMVYITSVGGRTAFAGGAMYHAAKFGLEGFAETVAQEVAGFGIKTVIVEPGSMKTDFIANVNWTAESDTYKDSTVGQVRSYIQEYGEDNIAGDPQKIAAAVYALTQLPEPPLRTALGVDTFAALQQAYRKQLSDLDAQQALAESVAFAGKTGFNPNS